MPTKPELLAAAQAAGITVPDDATKADLEQLLADHKATGPVRVEARWVYPDAAVIVDPVTHTRRLVRYGVTFLVTAEQLATSRKLIPADADFTPDPALTAAHTEES